MAIHNCTIGRLLLTASFLALLFSLGAVDARADTVVVAGILFNQDGTPARGFTVKVYAGKDIEVARDTTSTSGIYQVVKVTNVDAASLGSWHLTVEEDDQVAYSPLVLQRTPQNVLQAKVPDIKLRSSNQAKYSPNEAFETIQTLATIKSIRYNAGELKFDEANEQAKQETAGILGRTELGEDSAATIRSISQVLRQNFDKSLPSLPLLREEEFMKLLTRPEFIRFNNKANRENKSNRKQDSEQKPMRRP